MIHFRACHEISEGLNSFIEGKMAEYASDAIGDETIESLLADIQNRDVQFALSERMRCYDDVTVSYIESITLLSKAIRYLIKQTKTLEREVISAKEGCRR